MLAPQGKQHIAAMLGALVGAVAALMPTVSIADKGHRELATPTDIDTVILLTVLGLAALLVTASVLYLYRRQRNLHWDYQLQKNALSESDLTDTSSDEGHH